jgi:hypothetical protein
MVKIKKAFVQAFDWLWPFYLILNKYTTNKLLSIDYEVKSISYKTENILLY